MEVMNRWIAASHNIACVERFMIPLAQGIGRQDLMLRNADSQLIERLNQGLPDIETATKLTDQATLSYMWVLAAYELVRTLNQRLSAVSSPYEEAVRSAKHQYERIRMPLAKMESARRFSDDSHIAWPTLSRESGFSWVLGAGVVIARADLSMLLLTTLEGFDPSSYGPTMESE
jgi:hypothetical protein